MVELGDYIKRLTVKGILDYISEDRSKEIHVTDLVYKCPRVAYYRKLMPPAWKDEKSILTLWIGKKLHETPPRNAYNFEGLSIDEARENVAMILEQVHDLSQPIVLHELPLEYDMGDFKVVGRTDRVLWVPEEQSWVVIDRKTTESKIPREPYEHHVEQAYFYAVMMSRLYGITPVYGAIEYIQLSDGKSIQVKTFPILPDRLDDYESELRSRALVLYESLQSGSLPDARPYWYCKYCSYYEACFLDYNPASPVQ